MSDTTLTPSSAMGSFDPSGNYVPRKVTERDASFADEIAATFVEIKEGKLVSGTVVRITREEVLLEIGYKTEGVILARELTIRQDVDPATIVKLGEKIEALVLTLEDKEGRLLLSKKRAQYERAW
ncbi:MAG: S1 RNA-binding domain-containing protein, partial [Actinomycetota bacterium]